jgi:acyl-coenzyme A synthetase/AMP-(fatty) acid ligase
MDDIIKCCGEKVSPTEVESALLAVPGVKEVAVLGVPDEVLGEAVEAVVVLEDGANLTETELRRECFSRLESFMVPKSIRFRPALPRSPNGKVYKKDLA